MSVQSSPATGSVAYGLVSREYGVAEVIVTPRSAYVGTTVFPGMVTDSGELVILAVQRQGEDLGPGEARIKAGDSLLLQGTWAALDEQTRDPNVLLVDSPDAIRRQTAPLGPQAIAALVVLAAMIVLLTIGVVPAAVAGLLAAMAMLLLGVVTVEQAHRSLSWTTLILVAGMIPLSTAITQTGAADLLAGTIVNVVGGAGPYALLLGVFLIAAVLGQLISNTATALDSDPDRGLDCDGNGHVATAAADVCQCGLGGGLADPGGNAGQHDGHGAGRIPIHRLRETGIAHPAALPGGGGVPGASLVAVVKGGKEKTMAILVQWNS